MAFKEVETGVWKPENKGDKIEGILLKVEDNVGANSSYIYTLEVENQPISVWGSAVLDIKMAASRIGDKIQIVYDGLGEAKPGQSAPKLFKLLIDYDLRL